MHTLIFALAVQCFFPLFSEVSEFLGLSLVNPDSQPRLFTVTATPASGAAGTSGQVTVPGNGQRARLLHEILPSRPSEGWLRVDSDASGCLAYLASGTENALAGGEAAGTLSSSIFIPHIAVQTGFFELDASDTAILIVNPGPGAAAVNVELRDLGGTVRTNITVNVPGRGSHQFRASDPLGNVLPGNGMGGITFQGYAILSSTVPVAAWQQIETPISRAMLRGRGVEELRPTSAAVIPHFVFGGNYGTFINLINPRTNAVTLDLSAHDNQGNIIGETIRLTLAPGEARRSSVGEFFRVVLPAIFPAPVVTGYIRIREASLGTFFIAGNVEIFGAFQAGRGSTMLSGISDVAATQWRLPFAASQGGYFTGYAIAVQNDLLTVQTDVTVEVVAPDGNVVDRHTLSLGPRQRTASLIPDGLGSGFVRITSNLPVFVLGSIGSRDSRTLDQIPPLP
jgi:hypothetical protein